MTNDSALSHPPSEPETELIPGSSEPVRSTDDQLPGDGGEASISGQSRELGGERPTENLLYAGYGPLFRTRKPDGVSEA